MAVSLDHFVKEKVTLKKEICREPLKESRKA